MKGTTGEIASVVPPASGSGLFTGLDRHKRPVRRKGEIWRLAEAPTRNHPQWACKTISSCAAFSR
jgi:hypothetical protein